MAGGLFVWSLPAIGEDLDPSAKEINVGSVDEGISPTWTFSLKNITKEAIKCISVAATCTCTNVTFPKDSLQPGESMAITGAVSTVHLPEGAFKSVVDIKWLSADGVSKSEVVLIEGIKKIVADIYPNVLDMGVIEKPSDRETVLTVTGRKTDVEWESLSASAEALKTKVEKIGDHKFAVKVTYNYVGMPLGALHDTLSITLLNKDNKRVLHYSVAVLGSVSGSISIHPCSLFIGVIDSKAKETIPFTIQSKEGKRLQFIAVNAPNPFIKPTFLKAVDNKLNFQCEIDPVGKTGDLSGIITVHVKSEADIEIHIPCIAYARDPKQGSELGKGDMHE